jgi:hypothetical protein
MERTVKTEILEGDPYQTPCPPSGMAWSTGTRLVVFESRGEEGREDGFYSYLDGVGDGGNFFETDDLGPFATAQEAEAEARECFVNG